MNNMQVFSTEHLDSVFPIEKTNEFFEAMYGGAEDGAYDIRLRFEKETAAELFFNFELHQRPGMCLACNLTYGLPQVFNRHPLLAVGKLAQSLCESRGLQSKSWRLLPTKEIRRELHVIPLVIELA